MPEYCTCGAELPPDARFCHKCGKPQRDEPVVVAEEPEIAPPPPPAPAPPPAPQPSAHIKIGLALRTGLLTAVILFFLNLLFAPAGAVWLLVIGFLAVFFYQRRAGPVSLGGGARLGWISGLTSFVLLVLPPLVYLAARPEDIRAIADEMSNSGMSAAVREQVTHALQMPVGLLGLAALVVFSVFPLIGGLIGAKLLKKSG